MLEENESEGRGRGRSEDAAVVPAKMNKKAKLREIQKCSTLPYPNMHFNLYNRRRKLLIFDINKVLLYRQAKTSYFKVRPFAHEFIAGMSVRFTLAVWTSMTKKCAKPILSELFPRDSAPLLFNWYQNRCNAIPGDSVDEKPLFLKELSRVWGEYREYNESNTILVDDSSEKCVRNPIHTSIQPHPYEPYGPAVNNSTSASNSAPSLDDATSNDIASSTAAVTEPSSCDAQIIATNSESVVPTSSDAVVPCATQHETVVVDHEVEAPKSINSTSAQNNRDVTMLNSGRVTVEDVELKPDGPLWVYLDRIAQYNGSNKDLYELCGPYVC